MRTYYQGPTYTVEFDEQDTSCFVRHTDASPDVVGGRGAFVFDTLTGDLIKAKGAAKGQHEMEWLAFSQDAQDVARDELKRTGVAINPYDFGCDLPEIHNPKEGGDAEVGRIVVMQNPGVLPTRVRPGEEGYIANIDDDGVIYVEWEGGESSSLAADDTWELPTAWNPEPARISRTRGVKTMRGPYSAKRGYKPWITKRGKLGEGFLSTMSKKQREDSLDRCVKAYGYRSCLGSIMVLERAKKGPRGTGEGVGVKYAKKLEQSRNYLKKEYGGVGSFGPREKRAPARRAAEQGPGYDAGEVAQANPVYRLVVTAPDDTQAAARGRRFGRVIAVQAVGPDKWHVTVDQKRVAPNPSHLSEISLVEINKKLTLDTAQERLLDRLVFVGRNDGDAYQRQDPQAAVAMAFRMIVESDDEDRLHDYETVQREAVRLVRKRWKTSNPCPNPCFGLHVHGDQVAPVLRQIQGGRQAPNPGPDEHARRAHAYLREGQDAMRRAMEHRGRALATGEPRERNESCAYAKDAHRFALLAGHEVDDSHMKGKDAKHFHEAVAQLKGAADALLDDLECRWSNPRDPRRANPDYAEHYETALALKKEIDSGLRQSLKTLDRLMELASKGWKGDGQWGPKEHDDLEEATQALREVGNKIEHYDWERGYALDGADAAGDKKKAAAYRAKLPTYSSYTVERVYRAAARTLVACRSCDPQWGREAQELASSLATARKAKAKAKANKPKMTAEKAAAVKARAAGRKARIAAEEARKREAKRKAKAKKKKAAA